MTLPQETDVSACIPLPVDPEAINPNCELPYGLTAEHVYRAMQDFVDFLGFINTQLHSRGTPCLEHFLMKANFSSMVGEYMHVAIPKYCPALVKNRYHNGHPDLLVRGMYPDDSVQYAHEGVEIKASRTSSWQGHNPESVWLMVFQYDSSTPDDDLQEVPLVPFHFKGVYAAKLEEEDWNYSGRSAESRRTITATVNASGKAKMRANWVYVASGWQKRQLSLFANES